MPKLTFSAPAMLAAAMLLSGCSAASLGRQAMHLPIPTCPADWDGAGELLCVIPAGDPSLDAHYFGGTAPTISPIVKALAARAELARAP